MQAFRTALRLAALAAALAVVAGPARAQAPTEIIFGISAA